LHICLVVNALVIHSYIGEDPIGIELAGALKNVYAIAAGMADGLGFEANTRAMLITRGLGEMTRIGVAYGASPLTFLGLAGVGDLFLTCTSSNSRNYTVGYRLGKGEPLQVILDTLGSVAEGVTTAKGVKAIIDELGVTASIANKVNKRMLLRMDGYLSNTYYPRSTRSCMKALVCKTVYGSYSRHPQSRNSFCLRQRQGRR
jgi:glycerol-3-phosphate dehydrogenase